MNYKIYITLISAVSRLNKTGRCVTRCRIIYNKQRKEFSTGLFIYPKYWKRRKQQVQDDSEDSEYINTQLGPIIRKINQPFLFLQLQESSFSVDDIYTLYKGEKLKK